MIFSKSPYKKLIVCLITVLLFSTSLIVFGEDIEMVEEVIYIELDKEYFVDLKENIIGYHSDMIVELSNENVFIEENIIYGVKDGYTEIRIIDPRTKKTGVFTVVVQPIQTSKILVEHTTSYLSGYPDGSFRPNKMISKAEVFTGIVKAWQFSTEDETPYSDVDEHWSFDFIKKAYGQGLLKQSQMFKPDSFMNRAEFCELLTKLPKDNLSLNDEALDLIDLNNHWAYDYLIEVSQYGVFDSEWFKEPEEDLLRVEYVYLMNKILNKKIITLPSEVFTDLNETDDYYFQIMSALETAT